MPDDQSKTTRDRPARRAWRRLCAAWHSFRAPLAPAYPAAARDHARKLLAERPARAGWPSRDNRPPKGLHLIGDCRPVWINEGDLLTLQMAGYLVVEPATHE
jgi:hypothetical protein